MSETSYSTTKRSLGSAVRAQFWYREFREIVLMNQWHATLTNAFGDQLPHKGGERPERTVLVSLQVCGSGPEATKKP